MVSKVDRSPRVDASGVFRRPRMILRPKRAEDIPAILQNTKAYPSPIRPLGADYSQARCVGGDGGTTLDTQPLSKIIEIEGNLVRAQAGVHIGELVRILAERGLELPLTPEIANISLGAVATATLPQPSFAENMAHMSSCVAAIKLVTPQGRAMTVSEQEPDMMRVLRSSFGLLGVVHEVVLKVRDMVPVKIDYQSHSLKEFNARFESIVSAPGAIRLQIFPFSDRVTVERRILDEEASTSRSGLWQIRNSVMKNVLPAFGSSVGGVLAVPGLSHLVLSGVQRAAQATLDRAARGVAMYAHEWMRELPREAWKARHTYSLWSFPEANFPKILAQYFAFCAAYHKRHRYRSHLVHNSSRLHRDRGSLFSLSYDGSAFTIEPSSSGEKGWDDFLIDFNEFASSLGGTPTFNQTRALQPQHVAKAFGERLKLFRSLRKRTDPINRLQHSYFANLLG
ncbi:MAG: FAD-binding oxidoreductase [Proteobacteria bacterium]|nr:FAD-binding oxidoreductase [Pseudomonadota bacterium]